MSLEVLLLDSLYIFSSRMPLFMKQINGNSHFLILSFRDQNQVIPKLSFHWPNDISYFIGRIEYFCVFHNLSVCKKQRG